MMQTFQHGVTPLSSMNYVSLGGVEGLNPQWLLLAKELALFV